MNEATPQGDPSMVSRAGRLGCDPGFLRRHPSPPMARTKLTRSVDRGLARSSRPRTVLVAYAAKDGTTATRWRGPQQSLHGRAAQHLGTRALKSALCFARCATT